jgi:serine/threonine-protein kinase RIO1
VHGDLSEYNILIVSSQFIDCTGKTDARDELQAVLIDFGQAVDTAHPSADSLLQRDLDRVLSFFTKQGVFTVSTEEALAFVRG